jgi:hypothetical protein
MNNRVIVLAIFFLPFLEAFPQKISFSGESIIFRIEKDYFYVNGTYYLENGRNQRIVLSYPFPHDSIYGPVDSIYIIDLTQNEIIKNYKQTKQGILFDLNFNTQDDLELQISYCQKLLSRQAEYILVSTWGWHQPLEFATYKLLIPLAMEITSFSIQPDEFTVIGNEKVYSWHKKNFMPLQNMIFRYSTKK